MAPGFAEAMTMGRVFADEFPRVFAGEHQGMEPAAILAVSGVQQMVCRMEVLRDEPGGRLPLLK